MKDNLATSKTYYILYIVKMKTIFKIKLLLFLFKIKKKHSYCIY